MRKTTQNLKTTINGAWVTWWTTTKLRTKKDETEVNKETTIRENDMKLINDTSGGNDIKKNTDNQTER